MTPVIVAIPARNEVDRIGACLAALAAQPGAQRHIAGVTVFANNCSDDTVVAVRAAATPFPVHLVEAHLRTGHAHVGHARRGAANAALAFAAGRGIANPIIAGTDADSCVTSDWLAALLAAFAGSADAVCGDIDLETPVPIGIAAARASETAYAYAVACAAALLDPLAHDPWPNHQWCWGANLAVRARVLTAVGGSPLVDLAEDRALHATLIAADVCVRHSRAVRVITSARTAGRAPGGFADALATYDRSPAALADFWLEPAALAWRRARARGAARRQWGRAPGFGAAWASREASDPALAPQRVALADLAAETARLAGWISAAGRRSDSWGAAFAPPAAQRA